MDFDRVSMQSTGVRPFEMPGSDIRITGYLKKLKTMKKKFFVLRSTSSSGPARLEYYDSEKKFNSGHQAKRTIHLHTCFNINRKTDSRHKHSIALYTKEECFSVICEDSKQQETWLSLMLEYQNEFVNEDQKNREHFEFVWQVSMLAKGLGHTKNIKGPYRLCLTWHSVYLVKLHTDKPHFVFQWETVRSVGHDNNVFKMIVGKIAPTGEGELSMHSEDAVVTQNIHETFLNFMKNRDRQQDSGDVRRTYSESLHGSAAALARPSSEFRNRSETFTQGSCRTRPKVERPKSVHTRAARSTSHLHNTVSPASSPHGFGGFGDQQIMGAHRLRSNSNESKPSRACLSAGPEDLAYDVHSLHVNPALQEESDLDSSFGQDPCFGPMPPHPMYLEEELGGEEGEDYMKPTTSTPTSTPSSSAAYVDMALSSHKAAGDSGKEGWSDSGSSYMQMTAGRACSSPIPIHHPHPHPHHADHSLGYKDMSVHNPLPPVKEAGSTEGYLPMSPSYGSGVAVSQLKPDRVVCMLSEDSTDAPQPHPRTYSLGSRPVKPAPPTQSAYVDMSGHKSMSDDGRSCSAPHLINPHLQRAGRSGVVDSPTPSASPLSVSLKSDDSESFMEFDFYRPRTSSDSYNYRPKPSTLGLPHSALAQGHRPRSASHGQGARPGRRFKTLGEGMGRLSQEAVLRAHNTSKGSNESLKVSSSESLKKLSQEIRSKTCQLSSPGYMDMDRASTPPHLPSSHEHHPYIDMGRQDSGDKHEGYVDMSLGKQDASPHVLAANHDGYIDMFPSKTKTSDSFTKTPVTKTRSQEKSQDSDSTHTGAVRDSAYVNFDPQEGKKDARSSPSSTEAYVMYEPASSPGAKDSTSTDVPRQQGAGGKDGKKRGFFSLRHGHADSAKTASKKGDTPQNTSAISPSYGSTGDVQFGSLGRDIRRKSKDLSKAVRKKSNSFSKTFGMSIAKPGKALRKSPPLTKPLDVDDEYIEFCPTAVKSDSDSSQSSGSSKMIRSRSEATPTKEDLDYVGYEPLNIPRSSSVSTPRVSSSPSAGAYVPMDLGHARSGTHKVLKPGMKMAAKKSSEDPSPRPGTASDSSHSLPHGSVSLTDSSLPGLAKSDPVYMNPGPGWGHQGVGDSHSLPVGDPLGLALPFHPSSSRLVSTASSSITGSDLAAVCGGGGCVVPSSAPRCSPLSSGLPPDSRSTTSSASSISSSHPSTHFSIPSTHSYISSTNSSISSTHSSCHPSVSSKSSSHHSVSFTHPSTPFTHSSIQSSIPSTPPWQDGGYMEFDPGLSVSGEGSECVVKPAVVKCYISSEPSPPVTVAECVTAKPGQSAIPTTVECVTAPASQASPPTTVECVTATPNQPSPPVADSKCVIAKPSQAALPPTCGSVESGEATTAAVSEETEAVGGTGSQALGSGVADSPGSEGRRASNTETPVDTQCSKTLDASSDHPTPPANLPSPPQPPSPAAPCPPSPSGNPGVLNYATLDLGNAGDSGSLSSHSRSRHSSAAEDITPPLSYAAIDFDKTESLRNTPGKDVKLVL